MQQKQAAEATIAELQQSLQQERQRAETLSSDLGEVRREVEALATLSRQKNDEAAQLKRVAETAKAELQQSLPAAAREGSGARRRTGESTPERRCTSSYAAQNERGGRANQAHRDRYV
ncbi:hypothetical protein ACFIOY_35540 [Bradyrhizobium sp. TZ2]